MRIPEERVAILIGKGGSTKNRIEEMTGAKVRIDSKTGEIIVDFGEDSRDPILPLKVERLIKAIGRGFSPGRAIDLLSDDCALDIIDLRGFFGDNAKTIRRVKARIIGERGRARTYIERRTGANISVYGHTISIIGEYYSMIPAKDVILSLISGKSHGTAYKEMEKKIAEMKKAQFIEKKMEEKDKATAKGPAGASRGT